VLFSGEPGSSYGFLCVARDTAGNLEPFDGVAETSTTVEGPPRPGFHRGDSDGSGTSDLTDGVVVFTHLFFGSPARLSCVEAANANGDGALDISDGIYVLNWLFSGGAEPPPPGPPGAPCGPDPDPPGSAGDLGCESYSACP